MDLATTLGFIFAFLLVLGGMLIGGDITIFVDYPSLLITIGGSLAVSIMASPMERVKALPVTIKKSFLANPPDFISLVQTLVSFAEKARREGLLALEDDAQQLTDPFLKKGIQLVVDGTDPELVKNILDTEIGLLEGRHSDKKALFDTLAEMGPAFGMLGTLIGLIQMLKNLSDPDALGPGMAVALITSLYGSFLANVIWIPMSRKLAYRSSEEVMSMELCVEGVLAIQAGENPRIVEEKLKVFLPPNLRSRVGGQVEGEGEGK